MDPAASVSRLMNQLDLSPRKGGYSVEEEVSPSVAGFSPQQGDLTGQAPAWLYATIRAIPRDPDTGTVNTDRQTRGEREGLAFHKSLVEDNYKQDRAPQMVEDIKSVEDMVEESRTAARIWSDCVPLPPPTLSDTVLLLNRPNIEYLSERTRTIEQEKRWSSTRAISHPGRHPPGVRIRPGSHPPLRGRYLTNTNVSLFKGTITTTGQRGKQATSEIPGLITKIPLIHGQPKPVDSPSIRDSETARIYPESENCEFPPLNEIKSSTLPPPNTWAYVRLSIHTSPAPHTITGPPNENRDSHRPNRLNSSQMWQKRTHRSKPKTKAASINQMDIRVGRYTHLARRVIKNLIPEPRAIARQTMKFPEIQSSCAYLQAPIIISPASYDLIQSLIKRRDLQNYSSESPGQVCQTRTPGPRLTTIVATSNLIDTRGWSNTHLASRVAETMILEPKSFAAKTLNPQSEIINIFFTNTYNTTINIIINSSSSIIVLLKRMESQIPKSLETLTYYYYGRSRLCHSNLTITEYGIKNNSHIRSYLPTLGGAREIGADFDENNILPEGEGSSGRTTRQSARRSALIEVLNPGYAENLTAPDPPGPRPTERPHQIQNTTKHQLTRNAKDRTEAERAAIRRGKQPVGHHQDQIPAESPNCLRNNDREPQAFEALNKEIDDALRDFEEKEKKARIKRAKNALLAKMKEPILTNRARLLSMLDDNIPQHIIEIQAKGMGLTNFLMPIITEWYPDYHMNNLLDINPLQRLATTLRDMVRDNWLKRFPLAPIATAQPEIPESSDGSTETDVGSDFINDGLTNIYPNEEETTNTSYDEEEPRPQNHEQTERLINNSRNEICELPADPGHTNHRILSQNHQSIWGKQRKETWEKIVSLLTQNIRNGSPIAAYCIQETWTKNHEWLERKLNGSALRGHYVLYSDDYDFKPTKKDDGRSLGQGTCILLYKDLAYRVIKKQNLNGRMTAVLIQGSQNQPNILLASIYCPQRTDPDYDRVKTGVLRMINAAHKDTQIILAGDWNAVLNPSIDRTNSITGNPPQTQPSNSLLSEIMEIQKFKFQDPLRLQYPNEVIYSHKQNLANDGVSEARIDFILVTKNALPFVKNSWVAKSDTDSNRTHHKQTGITLARTGKAFAPPQREFDHTFQRIKHKDISEDQLKQFQEKLAKSELIQETNQEIETTTEPSQEKLDKWSRTLNSEISRCTKETLPMEHNNTGNHQPRLAQVPHDARRLQQIYDKRVRKQEVSPKDIHFYWKTRNHFLDRNPTDPTLRRLTAEEESEETIRYGNFIILVQKLDKEIVRMDNAKLRKNMKKREQVDLDALKPIINSVGQKRIFFEGVTYTRDSETGELKTQPQDVLDDIVAYFTEQYKAPEEMPIPRSWRKYYKPIKHPDPTIYDHLEDKITMEEMLAQIKSLGNKSAPGPTGLTYTHLKLISDKGTLQTMLNLINYQQKHAMISELDSQGKVILLSKVPVFTGDLDKTRPITLLEATRKLYTGILTTRLNDLLAAHPHLTDGSNYGFTRGRSTQDNLSIFRNTIDTANLTKKSLILISLDGKKAFDAMPLRGARMSMVTLGLPTHFIDVMMSILKNREIQVETPFGKTDKIPIDRGVPQGDKPSPTIWNVFYDPLLRRLNDEVEGYKPDPVDHPEVEVTANAFADDLVLAVTNLAEAQKGLDIANQFMEMHGMEMRPDKVEVFPNKYAPNLDQIKAAGLQIKQTIIKSIKSPNEIFRILGNFWTMDGDVKKTRVAVMKEIADAIEKYHRRYIPGQLSVYMVNVCLFSLITYRLQYTPITDSFAKEVDTLVLNLIKSKCNYGKTKTIYNALFYDPDSGYKLYKCKEEVEKRQLANVHIDLLREDLVGKMTRLASKLFQKDMKLPAEILGYPVDTNTHKKYFIPYISSRLLEHNIQLRQVKLHNPDESKAVWDLLTPQEYTQHAREIKKYGITTTAEFYGRTNRGNVFLNSYVFWANHGPNTRRDTEIFHALRMPSFYVCILNYLTNDPDIFKSHRNRETRFTGIQGSLTTGIKFAPKDPTPPRLQRKINLPNESFTAWSDGSYYESNGKQGFGIVISQKTDNSDHQEIQSFNMPIHETIKSSYTSEIRGLQAVCEASDPTNTILIKCDNKSAIYALEKFSNPKTTLRTLVKVGSHHSADQANQYRKINKKITLQHVKGHTGDLLQERSDVEAKKGANSDRQPEPFRATLEPTIKYTTFINGKIAGVYIRDILKNKFKKSRASVFNEIIKRKWQEEAEAINEVVNTKLVKELTNHGIQQKNYLDTSSYREESFRAKTITKRIPDRVTRSSWGPQFQEEGKTCPRCKRADETQNHIWTCSKSKKSFDDLICLAVQTMNKKRDTHKDYKKLKGQLLPKSPRGLLWMLGIENNSDFLDTLTAQGIITNQVQERFNSGMPHILPNKTTKTDWLKWAMDGWLTACFELIWKPRNDKTFKRKGRWKQRGDG